MKTCSLSSPRKRNHKLSSFLDLSFLLLFILFFTFTRQLLAETKSTTKEEVETITSLMDYDQLTNILKLQSFRAGNQTPQGSVNYRFKFTYIAYLDDPKENSIPIEKRKNIRKPFSTNWDLSILSLELWKPDKPTKELYIIQNPGSDIRILVSQAMKEFAVAEEKIIVTLELELSTFTKKYFFFEEGKVILTKSTEVIPPIYARTKMFEPKTIAFKDAVGLNGEISLEFKQPPSGIIKK